MVVATFSAFVLLALRRALSFDLHVGGRFRSTCFEVVCFRSTCFEVGLSALSVEWLLIDNSTRIDLFSKAFSGASHFLKGTFQGPEVDELAMLSLVQANNDRHKYMNLHTAMTERVVNLNSECA